MSCIFYYYSLQPALQILFIRITTGSAITARMITEKINLIYFSMTESGIII